MTNPDTASQLPHWGTRFYDREVWMVGADTDEVWCTFLQGTDRRSYAALNHYLRDNENPAHLRARGLPRGPLLPLVSTAWLLFTADGDLQRCEFHHEIDEPAALPVLVVDS